MMGDIAAAHPSNPYPIGTGTNCKREGWNAFHAGRGRDACPFPPGRRDLQRGYVEGWDAAREAAQ